MKIRFKASSSRLRYWSENLRFRDGDTAEVSEKTASHLFKYFPDNFEIIQLDTKLLSSLVHKPIRLSDITILNVCYRPLLLKKSLLSYLPKKAEFINLDNKKKRWSSMTKALNYGIRKARNDIIICVHEDTRFGKTWFRDFIKQECRLKNWGALGAIGYTKEKRVLWGNDYEAPKEVDLLDGFCLVLNRKNKLFFDDKTFTDWHRYELDFCLQCHEKRLGVYIITGAIYHDQHPKRHKKEWRERIAIDQELLEKKWRAKLPRRLEAAF